MATSDAATGYGSYRIPVATCSPNSTRHLGGEGASVLRVTRTSFGSSVRGSAPYPVVAVTGLGRCSTCRICGSSYIFSSIKGVKSPLCDGSSSCAVAVTVLGCTASSTSYVEVRLALNVVGGHVILAHGSTEPLTQGGGDVTVFLGIVTRGDATLSPADYLSGGQPGTGNASGHGSSDGYDAPPVVFHRSAL